MSSGWRFMMAAMVVVVSSFLLGYLAMARGEHLDTVYQETGVVNQVLDCSTGKRSMKCGIKLYNQEVLYTDVTSYPGNTLQPGDRMGVMYFVYERGEEMWVCRGNRCRVSGYCAFWMRCYDGNRIGRYQRAKALPYRNADSDIE